MIIGKSQKEIDKMRAAGQLVGRVLQQLRGMVAPGITTLDVDRAAEKMIRDAGAYPTFKGYNGFPFSICASVNEQVVHGFPSEYELKEGDIFSIDVGATLDGFVGDTATTVGVGQVSDDRLRLMRVTEESLQLAIEQCRAGNHLGDIGFAVQSHAEAHGYSIVRDYVGHGIGRKMHEDPQIPNYGKPGKGPKIKAGYVFALEPMVNMGSLHTRTLKDGWTVVTVDGQPSAHFEHTVAITEEGPEVLTRVRPTVEELSTAA
ncbi:MAG TPA: type I methionyl aminopeptidase [Pyrinomonadaceae bacterium]|jgi:methionyl aminopeptidase|nr:type I methionyl aminopeptidase [Pyrinomonadaceae bacterium]